MKRSNPNQVRMVVGDDLALIWRHDICNVHSDIDCLVHIKSTQRNMYSQTSNIKRILLDNKIVDHSHVVAALPVGAAPTTCSFST